MSFFQVTNIIDEDTDVLALKWGSDWEWVSDDARTRTISSLIASIIEDKGDIFIKRTWKPFVRALGPGGLEILCRILPPLLLKDQIRDIAAACSRSSAGPALVHCLAAHDEHFASSIVEGVIDAALLEGDAVLHSCAVPLRLISKHYATGLLSSLGRRRVLPLCFVSCLYRWDSAQAARWLLPNPSAEFDGGGPGAHWLWRHLVGGTGANVLATELLAVNASAVKAACIAALSGFDRGENPLQGTFWPELVQQLRLYCLFLLLTPDIEPLREEVESTTQEIRSVLEVVTAADFPLAAWPSEATGMIIWCDILSGISCQNSKCLDLWRVVRNRQSELPVGLAPYDLFLALSLSLGASNGAAGILLREHLAFQILHVPLSWIPSLAAILRRCNQLPFTDDSRWSPDVVAREVSTLPPPSLSAKDSCNAAVTLASVELCLMHGGIDLHDWLLTTLENEHACYSSEPIPAVEELHPGIEAVVDRYADQCCGVGGSLTPLLPFELTRFTKSWSLASTLALRFIRRYQESSAALSSLPPPFDYSLILIPSRKRLATKDVHRDDEFSSWPKRSFSKKTWDH
jgi:hypothetical protein